jgi:ribonuclease VapC
VIALDASALLAFLFQERGRERVAEVISETCISTVNLSEVIGRFVRDGFESEQVLEQLLDISMEIVPFLSSDAALAASLVPATRRLGLSLGDRACLALAASRGISALTADRTWTTLNLGIQIESIR